MTNQGDKEHVWRMPDGSVVAVADAERLLVEAAHRCEGVLAEAVRQLLKFYSETGQPWRAIVYLERLVRMVDAPETKALALLRLGLLRERLGDFVGAATAYTEALALEPADPDVAYWVCNNFLENRVGALRRLFGMGPAPERRTGAKGMASQ